MDQTVPRQTDPLQGLRAALWLVIGFLMISAAAAPASAQPRYHTPPDNAHPLMQRQHEYSLPSLLVTDDGGTVESAEAWHRVRRPELMAHWTRVLGKLEPTAADTRWFGDITQAVEISREQRDGYTRVELQLPMETDFLQPHLLLIPDHAAPGSCPAVIAWTATTPDYTEPEKWWGAKLARRGFVVLTGWSFIRNYRDGTSYQNGVSEVLYRRFGHWLPMAKMVHDVQREAQYLQSLPIVRRDRIGFMGFSLSGKAALYVAAFAPEIHATAAIDPHLAIYGNTNYQDPWYLDWERRFPGVRTSDYPVPELQGTIWSLLDADPTRPGFERDHHELLALCAPRHLMVIGCSTDRESAPDSDDRQSSGYVERAQEVYQLLGIPDRLEYVPLTCGHEATNLEIDAAWQRFFERSLR